MNDKKGISGGIIAVSVFAGAVLGAAAGLILAPQSGKETREKLRKAYGEVEGRINDIVEKANEKVPVIVSRVSSEIKGFPGEFRGELQKLKEDTFGKIDKVIEKGKSYIEEVKETASSSLEAGKKKFIEEKEKIGKY
jgi:gas vesicle protein